jgi:hypothetical protein
MRLGAMYTREFNEIERRMPGLAQSMRETMAARPWDLPDRVTVLQLASSWG